ncbi:hypothetical protein MML48_4g00007783 [Holotrichia oblita]|uniref:Uncharacterized protein n=1 Tax=Holotrichia oblita TaxID=644536 RepID=A0ACB9TBD3_HOLOL|nr:hypothetical protein MML48_4g00007783 [Holotrichia oblita]
MYVLSGSSFIALLVICLCSLISVVEVRVAKPVAYEFGDRIPKTADLDGASSVDRKATVVKRQPQTVYKPANVVATIPVQIPAKKATVQRTRSAKKATIPIKKQQQFVAPVVYNVAPAKQEKITNTPIVKQQLTSPTVAYTAEPIKAITRKPELAKNKEKTLQTPLTFSYNNDLKTSASHGGEYVVAESDGSNHGGSDGHQGGGGGDGGNHHREPHDWSYEKGGGRKHHAGHHSAGGEKGVKEYDGDHEYVKAEKGYHDKEGHQGKYKDEVGNKKSHNYDDGIYGEYHKGEKGERGSKKANTRKATIPKENTISTRKKNMRRNTNSTTNSTKAGTKKNTAISITKMAFKKGGSSKGAHHKSNDHEDHYGKKGHHLKEDHYDYDKGHNVADGHDQHYNHKAKHGKKGGYKDGKKWGHESGGGSGSRGKRGSGHPQHSPIYQVAEEYDGYYPIDSHTHYIVTHY